jgi:hypothetical protein
LGGRGFFTTGLGFAAGAGFTAGAVALPDDFVFVAGVSALGFVVLLVFFMAGYVNDFSMISYAGKIICQSKFRTNSARDPTFARP